MGAEDIDKTADRYRVLFAGGVRDAQTSVLKALMGKHPEAAYFDLRSPDRVVVGPESSDG